MPLVSCYLPKHTLDVAVEAKINDLISQINIQINGGKTYGSVDSAPHCAEYVVVLPAFMMIINIAAAVDAAHQ